MRTPCRMAFGLAAMIPLLWAQSSGGPPPVGGENIRGTGLGRLSPASTGADAGSATRPLNGYLTGNVKLDDGTAPPDPVVLERVCSGAARKQGYTDRKGGFSLQIGATAGVMQDAREETSGLAGTPGSAAGTAIGADRAQQLTGVSATPLTNCELRAVLAGYRSGVVSLDPRRISANPSVGTIWLHRLANVEGSAISLTSLRAPKQARRAYEKAFDEARKNKLAEAARDLQNAVKIAPDFAAAWYELGLIERRRQQIEQARGCFSRAIAADEKFVSPYLELAGLEAEARNWTGLARTTGKLLKLDAVDYPMAYFYDAIANLNLGRPDDAEKSARAGLAVDKDHRCPSLSRTMAALLASKGDYVHAAEHLRTYLLFAPGAPDFERMKTELAKLDRLSGASEQAQAPPAQH